MSEPTRYCVNDESNIGVCRREGCLATDHLYKQADIAPLLAMLDSWQAHECPGELEQQNAGARLMAEQVVASLQHGGRFGYNKEGDAFDRLNKHLDTHATLVAELAAMQSKRDALADACKRISTERDALRAENERLTGILRHPPRLWMHGDNSFVLDWEVGENKTISVTISKEAASVLFSDNNKIVWREEYPFLYETQWLKAEREKAALEARVAWLEEGRRFGGHDKLCQADHRTGDSGCPYCRWLAREPKDDAHGR